MIPRDADAILMCEEAPIRMPISEKLCGTIIARQQTETEQTKAKLTHLRD